MGEWAGAAGAAAATPGAPRYRAEGESWRNCISSMGIEDSFGFVWERERIGRKVVGSKVGVEKRWGNCLRTGSSGNNSRIRASRFRIWAISPYLDSCSCIKANMGFALDVLFGFAASLLTEVSNTALASRVNRCQLWKEKIFFE